MEKHREHPLAYPPISKVLVKKEPGERWENVIADSSPLPRSVIIQKEPQSGDAGRASNAEFNSESSSDEDGEECRLVAYPPLPRRIIKEEIEIGDNHHDSGVQQQTLNQGREENRRSEATDDAAMIAPFVGSQTGSAEMSTTRTLRSHSKRSSSAVAQGRKSSENRKKKDEDFMDEKTTDAGWKKTISEKDEPVRPFKCMKCQRVYKQKKNLNRHMVAECGVEPKFACTECGKKFKWKAVLKDHLLKVHNIGRSQLAAHGIKPKALPIYPFKCGKRARTYKMKGSLARHENKCGMKDKPRFPCTLCDERLASKCGLREHLKFVHTVARTEFANYGSAALRVRPKLPFKSENCEKSYQAKNSLKKHVTYHCGIDPSLTCTKCDFVTKYKASLIRHLTDGQDVWQRSFPYQIRFKKGANLPDERATFLSF